MSIYYSAKQRGFYVSSVHDQIPKDGVKIDAEDHAALMVAQSSGMVIVPDGKGYPVLQKPAPPSPEQLAATERKWRDAEVLRVSWLRDRHRDQLDAGVDATLTAGQFGALLAYLQALRDWPQSSDFPDEKCRPLPPDWIAEQAQ